MKKGFVSPREAVNSLVVLGGVGLIVWQVVSMAESRGPMVVVAVGIMMIYLGILDLGTQVLPNRRVYNKLRSEVEKFLVLVRKLNAHAVSDEPARVESVRTEMHDSVDRMVSVAGLRDEAHASRKQEQSSASVDASS